MAVLFKINVSIEKPNHPLALAGSTNSPIMGAQYTRFSILADGSLDFQIPVL